MTDMETSARNHGNYTSLYKVRETDTCSLCLKTFIDPKILSCFHTFCSHCLQDYVEVNAHNSKFACPECASDCILPPGGVQDIHNNFYIKAAHAKIKVAANSTCQICEDDSRAARCCIECEQNLCHNCSHAHLKMTSSRHHHIVTLMEKTDVGENQITSNSFCNKHTADELSFYCRKCSIPICLRCKVTSHEQHTTDDLSDVAAEIRVLLTSMLKDAQKLLPAFHGHLNDITFYNDQLDKEREKLKNEITEQTDELINRVKRMSQQMTGDIDEEYCVEMSRIATRRNVIRDKTSAFSAQLHSANQVIRYGSDPEIAWNRSKLLDQLQKMSSTTAPTAMVHLKMDFIPSANMTSSGIGDLIGSLKKIRDTTESVKVEECSSFSVDNSFKAVSCVSPGTDGTANTAIGWTAHLYTVHRQGTKLQSHVISNTIDFMLRCTENQLLFSSNEHRIVGKIGSDSSLEIFATFPGYHPRGLAMTSDGDILVCLAQSVAFQDYRPNHTNKVVRLTSSGKMVSEYGGDGKMFMYPLRVAVNVNKDICVSDSRKQRVVMVKFSGELKTEYRGGMKGEEGNFEPRGIACDPRGHVFVADGFSHAVHMLDHVGTLLRMVVRQEDGIYGPYSVAMDADDFLWVGCRDANVKVFKLIWT